MSSPIQVIPNITRQVFVAIVLTALAALIARWFGWTFEEDVADARPPRQDPAAPASSGEYLATWRGVRSSDAVATGTLALVDDATGGTPIKTS